MRQRGIAEGWLILIVLAAISGALWYAYTYVDGKGYTRGKSETESVYAKRDNEALRAASDRIQALQTAARARETEHAAQVADISEKYQNEVDNGKRKVAVLTASVRAGALRLRDVGAACPAPGGGGSVPETRPGAGGRDAAAGTDVPRPVAGILSSGASEFLIRFAGEADDVTRQLTACQAVVRSDRGQK